MAGGSDRARCGRGCAGGRGAQHLLDAALERLLLHVDGRLGGDDAVAGRLGLNHLELGELCAELQLDHVALGHGAEGRLGPIGPLEVRLHLLRPRARARATT